MAQTYCGKTCSDCSYKETLSCPGCKTGPGRQFGGDCELARCCRSKGHEVCATCGFSGSCNTLRGKERIPENRRRHLEYEAEREAAIGKAAPTLAKWLWILFWLVVPGSVASILSMDFLAQSAPGVFLAGQILNALCSAAYGLILLRLSGHEDHYKTAGICTLGAAAVSTIIIFLFGGSEAPTWTLLLSVPAAIVGLVGEYNEFTAHSIILDGVDNDLSEKWSSLWKWTVGSYGCMIGGLLLTVLIPLLGLLAVLAGAIGVLVFSILKLVRLYGTAQAFRNRVGL